MPDFGKRSGGGESLDAIADTDRLLDALAAERRVQPRDAGDAALFSLLENWRDDVRLPSAAHVITEHDAAAALHDGLVTPPVKRGGYRGLTIVASLAAAVLCVGGFGAVVSTAGPGDPLYGVRTTLFGEGKAVRDVRVALASKQEMEQVQQLITQGDWEQAQQKLQAVSTEVQSVDDVGTKTDLVQQWNELSVKVGTRDPAATLPPVEPGAPAFAPPPGVTLLELPTVTTTPPPSGDISTPPTEPTSRPSTTSETPTSPETTTTTSPVVEAPAPVTSSGTSSPATSTSPTSSAPAAVAPPPTSSTAATTTSAATTSTAPTATTSVPPGSSQAPQVVTTTTAATTTLVPAPAPSSVVVTTTTTTTAAAAPRATVAQRAPDVITTTTPLPVLPLLPAEG